MQLKRISILGVGLLGGSIGLALKKRASDCVIVGYGHRRSTVDAAVAMGALDEGYDTLRPAVRGADLVILCTPVGIVPPLLGELASLLERLTLVTDVGSTKRSIVTAAEQLLPFPGQFVGSHPMAGSEKRGVEFARDDLYDNALCIITPTARTDAAALQSIEDFWGLLGMRTCRLTPQEHDQRLADVSHLPHALAAALVGMQHDDAGRLAGKGFRDMTRIAGGDGGLWRDILIDNRDNVRDSIRRFQQQLQLLDALLQKGDGEALRDWLDICGRRRQMMLDAETDKPAV